MNPRFAADTVLVLHALFIAFAVFGGLLTYKKGQWKKPLLTIHLTCAAWAATVVTMGWTCPLPPLEQQLRSAARTVAARLARWNILFYGSPQSL